MYYLPWWVLLASLLASALAAYLVLKRTQAGDSPWALFPLTAALASVVLVGAMVAAIALSTLLSAFKEGRTGPPAEASEPRALTDRTRSPTTTVEKTHPATTEEQTTTATAISTASAKATATATATATAASP